jgi:hypothetical protein
MVDQRRFARRSVPAYRKVAKILDVSGHVRSYHKRCVEINPPENLIRQGRS